MAPGSEQGMKKTTPDGAAGCFGRVNPPVGTTMSTKPPRGQKPRASLHDSVYSVQVGYRLAIASGPDAWIIGDPVEVED